MPCRSSVSRGPMPDTMRSWGDWNAPALMITSLLAYILISMPGIMSIADGSEDVEASELTKTTPMAFVVPFSKIWSSVRVSL